MARTASGLSVIVTGDVGTLDQTTLGSATPLTVAVLDGSGNQVTSFGSGTQLDDGDTVDTDTQGTLAVGTTGINGTARVVRVTNDGKLRTTSSAIISGIDSTGILAGTRVYINNPSGSQAVNVQDGGNSLTVDATNLDIRDLTFAADKVDASGSALGSNSGVDIGDVTINNASGGSAVNIQDGGNTITVDGTVNANVTAATTSVLAGTRVYVNNPSGSQAVNIQDGGNSITVDGGVTAVGTIADDATTPGAPVMIGGTAKNFDGTAPGNVSAEDDVTRLITDRNRRLLVNDVHPQYWSYHTDRVVGDAASITDEEIQAAPGANTAVFVTDVTFSCSSTVAGVELFFEEGTTKVLGPYYLEGGTAGRGMHVTLRTPKKITTNTALTLSTVKAASAVEYSIDVQGFVSRVD